MNLLLVSFALVLPREDDTARTSSAHAVAMVLKVQGDVVAEGRRGKRKVEPGDYLLATETIEAQQGAEALLVILARGQCQRLKPGSRAKLTRAGCDPAAAVEPAGNARLSHRNLIKVREIEVREGGGVGVLRGPEKLPAEPHVTPIYGTFLLTRRPAFTWPALAQATGYMVELKNAGGQSLWQANTKEPKLPYPADKKALELGLKYVWMVKARMPNDDLKVVIQESTFLMLLPGEPEELADVHRLAESDHVEDLVQAAAAYESYRVQDEALKVLEKLARLQPQVARYQRGLAIYYKRAGRVDEAETARKRAESLEKQGAK
jgi:hypothetical protein